MKSPGTYTLPNGQTYTILSAELISEKIESITVEEDRENES